MSTTPTRTLRTTELAPHASGLRVEKDEQSIFVTSRSDRRRDTASPPPREALKQVALLCAAGLLASLLSMTYGLDLSPGFF